MDVNLNTKKKKHMIKRSKKKQGKYLRQYSTTSFNKQNTKRTKRQKTKNKRKTPNIREKNKKNKQTK